MRGGIRLLVGVVLVSVVVPLAVALRCDRTPEGNVAPKTPADNRFQLKISGSPDKYVPGEGYTISLFGQRNHGQVAQKFTGFMLVVESQSQMPLRVLSPRDVTPRPVGVFQLYGDTLTKFSASCPNMVTHTSSMPKSEIQVRWTAPPPGSGCVIFRATVIEHRDVWYQDDGPLSRMLCEEVQESHDSQPEILDTCCACDEAKYEVTFEGLWSRHTHPKDFPSNSWLTRFSDVIGASHSTEYRFWDYGGYASDGLKQVAERGSTRKLESELKSQSQHIRTIIKARGISYPNVTGKTFAVFRVDKLHHLMSLVSMIDPSPDWFVGVAALELCLRNCSWIEVKTLNLYPWDAGTDSGATYISPDQSTDPREKIRRITSSFPNDPRSPFYDPSGAEMKPLARLYLTRQRLYEKTCEDEPMSSNECSLSDWSEWGQCTATCGPGYKHRQRQYLHRNKGQNCPPARLTDKKSCNARPCRWSSETTPEPAAADTHCDVSPWNDWSRCMPVDQTCTRGTQTRYRNVEPRDPDRRKYCIHYATEESRDCHLSMSPSICPKNKRGKDPFVYQPPQSSTCCKLNETGSPSEQTPDPDENDPPEQESPDFNDDNDEEGTEEPSPQCIMTDWSDWSPCSVTCGVGKSKRTRKLLHEVDNDNDEANYSNGDQEEREEDEEEVDEPRVESRRRFRRNNDADVGETLYGDYGEGSFRLVEEEYAKRPCSTHRIMQAISCNGTYTNCQFNSKEATGEEAGEETTTKESEGDKMEESERPDMPLPSLPRYNQRSDQIQEVTEKPEVSCKFSRWSTWSSCQAACGKKGYKEKTRFIVSQHAYNGGKDCVGNTRKQRVCVRRCNNDGEDEEQSGEEDHDERRQKTLRCEYSEWSEWTECTGTCGYHAVRQRTRFLLTGNPTDCTDRIRRKSCNVGPCPSK